MEVLEDHHDRAARGEPLEERPPRPEELLRPRVRLEPEQRQQRRPDPRPLGLVGDVLLEHRGDRRPGRRLVVGLLEVGPAADHLAERPERDPLAVGRAAAVVPPDRLDQPVDVLEELPGQARLADPGRADDADQPRPALAGRGVVEVLELAELLVATDERRLERLGPADAAALGDDADRAPGGDRARACP